MSHTLRLHTVREFECLGQEVKASVVLDYFPHVAPIVAGRREDSVPGHSAWASVVSVNQHAERGVPFMSRQDLINAATDDVNNSIEAIATEAHANGVTPERESRPRERILPISKPPFPEPKIPNAAEEFKTPVLSPSMV